MSDETVVLGIETSCDETAAAVVAADGAVLSNVVASQDSFHAHFGGVVPEIASRRHTEVITAVVEDALRQASLKPADLSLIAATQGPGLVGSLVVGVAAAKAYSLAWGLPLVAVNHVEAHLYAAFLHPPGQEPPARPDYPSLCLIVSGGHTDLVAVHGPGEYELLGCTRDDAAGEALDKAARLLGLGFPGGPAIQRAAADGRADAVPLPRPVVDGYDFSFAGLKTALARAVEERPPAGPIDVADFAASFQEAVVDVLWATTSRALAYLRPRQLIVAGGVAANRRLREVFAAGAEQYSVRLAIPPIHFCTDNAAMVALCGFDVYRRSGPAAMDFDVFSALPSPGGPEEKT
ncbi:MAG: tRNA (adenosine(37)-N6)-threonylcarbamoyltransferase complex transferase subunit TsaD [Armatimonadetes bacterium]|nr:tRNA (adenosine(37)-N6)-threonylcarbamoyltransferase complex transferase subunit TsaD [Armatimonadota bacterium]